MNKKNDIEVLINNKKYVLCGYESEEYLQKVASYINNKYVEFRLKDSYGKLDTDLKNVLLEINIADDYFKAQKQVRELEEDMEQKNNELFDMKHEIIAAETKIEALTTELEELKSDYLEAQKNIIKLETELSERTAKDK